MDFKYVLDNIIREIKKQKLTQNFITNKMGIQQTAFAEWKKGKSHSYIRYIPVISEILNVPITELVKEEDVNYLSEKFWKKRVVEKDKKLYCKDCGFYIHGLCVRKKLYTPFPSTGFCNYAVARSDSESKQCSKCIKKDICVFKVDNNGECLYFAGNQ